ncbi:hypothetical protein QAD02_012716 [Eretmocerus hayati]|uniref:Uncharacterized protein n=1 Tax=Eretmocerus hayati TaxID=131215 RepID=A0ACC2P071_9HYME|nr:hypothetical protein QAD02_012716 [Eretmocerus hayati]
MEAMAGFWLQQLIGGFEEIWIQWEVERALKRPRKVHGETLRHVRSQHLQTALGGASPTASPKKKKANLPRGEVKYKRYNNVPQPNTAASVRARRVLLNAKNVDETFLSRLSAVNNGKESEVRRDEKGNNHQGPLSTKTVSAKIHVEAVNHENSMEMAQDGGHVDDKSVLDQDEDLDLIDEEIDQRSSRGSTPDPLLRSRGSSPSQPEADTVGQVELQDHRNQPSPPIQPQINAVAQVHVQFPPSPPPIQPQINAVAQFLMQSPPPPPNQPQPQAGAIAAAGPPPPPPVLPQVCAIAPVRVFNPPPPPPVLPQVRAIASAEVSNPPPPPPVLPMNEGHDGQQGPRAGVHVHRQRGDVLRMYQVIRHYYLNDPAGIADKERRGKVMENNPLETYVGEGIDLFDDYIVAKGFPDGIATKWRLSVPDCLTDSIQNAGKTVRCRRAMGVLQRQVDGNNRPFLPRNE